MVNIQKLAAVDIYLHGRVFVLIEFGGAVLLLGVPGVCHILQALSIRAWPSLWYWYFATVAINYIPLLVYAAKIAKNNTARVSIETDLLHGRKALQKYSIQQLWVVIPFVIPIAALIQEIQERWYQNH